MSNAQNNKQLNNNSFPNDWDVMKGVDISVKITKGSSPNWQGFKYQKDGVLFVTSENVRDGFLDVSEPKYLPFSFNDKLKNSILKKGDILINIVGASIGRSCIYNIETIANTNQAVCILRPNKSVQNKYISYFLQFSKNIEKLLNTQTDSARPNLTLEDIRNFQFIIPPLPEQKAISLVLELMDKTIATNNQLIFKKELRKKWLMQQLLTGKKRLKGFRGEWKEKKLEYFIKDYKQKPNDQDNLEVLTSAKTGLMKQTDYYGDNRITNRDDADYNVIPPNYLTYRSRSDDGLFTFNKNDLGITGLISGYYPVFTIKNGDINFILMYMNYYRQKLTKYAIGTSQLVLALSALKEAKFNMPIEEEQTAIAKVLQAADKEISLLKSKAEKLREQKKGLMQKLLTGKKRLSI